VSASTRSALDATAVGAMVVLCALWGFNQVAAKLAAPGVSLVMQAGLRSTLAALLLFGWALARGTPLFGRDGTLAAGLAAGLLFGAEFVFIFYGLGHTTASRMIVFVYLAPCFTALGLGLLVPGERLTPLQWVGVLAGFAGVAIAFSENFGAGDRSTLFGDACGVIAGLFWAATTVLIRMTRLAQASATKTLLYQLVVSAPMLYAASFALGEPGIVRVDAVVIASLVYQGAIVAFASYLVWFWLLTRYLAARLSVFSFLTPLFGVAAGALVLGEPVSARLLWGALAVGIGIALVNRRD
jgi:drug/metabolite transporter (DMT)-like permease